MKKFLSMLGMSAMILAFGMMASCSESTTDQQGTPTPPTPVEDGLTLTVDKDIITADGKSMAIFTLTDKDGKDVTAKAKITCSTTSTALAAYVFTTTEAGEYEFYATYESTKSNTVKVTATEEELHYTLSVSPAEILADGIGMATFTVKDEAGKDVTSEAVIYCVTEDKDLKDNTFSTYNAGEYKFFAKMFTTEEEFEKSNTVTLTAKMAQLEGSNPTPIRWSEMKAVPTSTVGCEIEVTGVQNKNFQFVIRPGAEVVTYRLDVYPLCRLYNSLFVQLCNNENYEDVVEWYRIEEQIRSYVFDASGAGAYTFDSNGGEEREFDWMNTHYDQADVVPDAEYLIVVVGCTDNEGFEQGEMTIAYLKTPSEDLIGNPEVDIEVETGWKKARVSHKAANDDCKYFYHFYSWEGDLQPYVMAYGRKMYRDFMRHTLGAPIDINDGDSNWYMLSWGAEADPSVVWMATAVGLDRNETPAEDFQTELFQLKEIPENIVEGTGTMAVDESRTSSSIVWYDYTIDANARTMFNKLYNSSTIAENGNDEGWCATTATDILNNGGWGHSNPNFKYSEDLEAYTGSSFTGREFQVIQGALMGNGTYEPGGEYQFAYLFKDAANNASGLSFSEPFHIKTRVKNNPSACQSNGTAVLTAEGRTSVKFACTYDFENTSCVYFTWFFGDPTNMTSEEIVNMIFNESETGQVEQMWPADEGGYDEFTISGVDPDTEYTMLYVFEDWNGVFGEGHYTTCTTKAGDGGENPVAEISYQLTEEGMEFSFQANEDTKYMRYAAADKATYGVELELNYLGERYEATPQADAQFYYDLWTMWVIGEAGMTTYNTTAGLFNALGSDDLWVVLCVPFGKDDVRGETAYVIYDHGQIKTLHDYYDYEGEPYSVKRATSAPKIGQPKRHEIPAMLKRPVELKWENSIDKIQGHELKVIDMRTIASHPKAR